MKHFLFLAVIPLFVLSGCATDGVSTSQEAASSSSKRKTVKEVVAEEEEEAEQEPEAGSVPPRIGMTKAQVRAKYGTPVSVSRSSSGEMWTYVFNNWDGRVLIPYYGAFHSAFKQRHSGMIHFGANGRVKDYNWNESNPIGGTVWR